MRRTSWSAAVAAIALLGACGSDTPATSNSAPATAAAKTAATAAPIAAPAAPTTSTLPPPSKIISLSPTATEMLFAIGAGGQVLAVDDQSNFPPEARQLPHDLSGFTPNVEAIAALKPDLVVIGDDSSGLSKQLDALGLATWVGPSAKTFDDVYTQIEQLGAKTGHVSEAAALVMRMQTDIAAAVAAAPKPAQPLTYYHELDNTYFSVSGNTFIGQVYSLLGLKNIADQQQVSSDFPQLSAEAIISADPDFIFLADGGLGESAETVAGRPGWDAIKAVKNGNVVVVDADISSRWGPRIVDFIKAVSAALAKSTVSG